MSWNLNDFLLQNTEEDISDNAMKINEVQDNTVQTTATKNIFLNIFCVSQKVVWWGEHKIK